MNPILKACLDIHIAGSLQYPEYRDNKTMSTGLDLALLSLCNHTITSYGSYSFWASFLAGEGLGRRIIPQFFTKYRLPSHGSHQLSKHPFRSRLPRFFHGLKNMGRWNWYLNWYWNLLDDSKCLLLCYRRIWQKLNSEHLLVVQHY